MNLLDIVSIKEIDAHHSVGGITREYIMPLDYLKIDTYEYRIYGLERMSNNTTCFFAADKLPSQIPEVNSWYMV
jgi:hypothetical protein